MKCISKPDRIFRDFCCCRATLWKKPCDQSSPPKYASSIFSPLQNPSNPFKKNVVRKKYRLKLLRTHQKRENLCRCRLKSKNIVFWISVQKSIISVIHMRYAYILMTKIDGTPKDRAQRRQSSRGFLFRLRRWMCAVATGEEATTSSAAASTKAPLELQLRSENSALATKGWKKSLIPASNLNGGCFDKMMNACWHFCCNCWTLPFWNWRKKVSFWSLVCVLRSLD